MTAPLTASERAKLGGKASKAAQLPKAHAARRLQAAKERAAKAVPEEPAAAPLPGWLTGDKTGLPMKPPRREEK